jgi:hypothetical protein
VTILLDMRVMRPCLRCAEQMELRAVNPNGLAYYVCPRGHESFVDESKESPRA